MGSALRPGSQSAPTLKAQTDQRQLAGGRNLHPGQRQVGVFIPRGGFHWGDHRLPSFGQRDAAAAERFLAKALGGVNRPAPRVINTDKHAGYPPAIVRLKAEDALQENCWASSGAVPQ